MASTHQQKTGQRPAVSCRVAEALDQLRDKDTRATTLERLVLTHAAWLRHRDLPQPLQFAAIVGDLLQQIEVPVRRHDLLLGRIREILPNPEQEAQFREILKSLPGGLAPCMTDGGHETLDWERLLERGLPGLEDDAVRQCERQKAAAAPQSTIDFLQGMIGVYQALRIYARRYAQAARAEGMTAAADTVLAVAERAPISFREGLQLMWLVGHVYCTMMSRNPTLTFGRIDQWLFPFYRRDLEAGTMTVAEAGDLIEDFYCKNNLILGRGEHQMSNGSEKATGWLRNLAYDAPQYIVLGGTRGAGRPDCSELTRLFVERIVPRFENPYVVIRFWQDIPQDLWSLVCAKLRDNASMMVYNDGCVIPAMEYIGIPSDEAVEYTMHGCNWPDLPPSQISQGCAWNNLPALLLAALPAVRPAGNMDEVYEAFRNVYRQRLAHGMTEAGERIRHWDASAPGTLAMDDCFLRGPVENARSKRCGGVKYRTLITTFGGFATLVDSLAAIEHLVFRERTSTMAQLVDAISANFEGHDRLRQQCLAAPKWGRNDERADTHAVRVMRMMQEDVDELAGQGADRQFVFRCVETDMEHIRYGRETGATPDGRLAGKPVSENTSPTPGACTEGVTSLLESVSKLPLDRCHSGALNLRLSPKAFPGEKGAVLLGQLLRTYFSRGGLQVQLSMVDTDTLRAAQVDPKQYQDLMVRITGYSAAFVDMGEGAQNEIIRREEMAVS